MEALFLIIFFGVLIGQFAEGKHCFTSVATGSKSTSRKRPTAETQVPRRKDVLARQVLHNETFDN